MRKYLLPEKGNLYKANLHSHSTVSDGTLTPEEMKKAYMEKGYSIIAYTDHEVLFTHNGLSDENFLALNGSEISVESLPDENGLFKVCHLSIIAKDKNNDKQVCFHPNYLWWFSDEVVEKFVNEKKYVGEYYNRVYSADGVNDMIKIAKENGFFVTYNHIGWSKETLSFVSALENLDGFEVFNYGAYLDGLNPYCGALYDDLLLQGKRMLPIAADDNHNLKPADDVAYDSFGGFTYIKAPDLSYESVISAMENGDMYASTGPVIKSLYFEDGRYYIETSPVREIFMRTGVRHGGRVAATNASGITEGVFDGMDNDVYVRFVAVDFSGNIAETRAYELKDFYEKNTEDL